MLLKAPEDCVPASWLLYKAWLQVAGPSCLAVRLLRDCGLPACEQTQLLGAGGRVHACPGANSQPGWPLDLSPQAGQLRLIMPDGAYVYMYMYIAPS